MRSGADLEGLQFEHSDVLWVVGVGEVGTCWTLRENADVAGVSGEDGDVGAAWGDGDLGYWTGGGCF